MKERSDLMGLFLKHGVGSLSDMRRIYDGLSDNPEDDNWLVRARKNVTDFLGWTNHYGDYRRNQRVADAILKEHELANDPPGPAHRLPDGTIAYGEKPLVNVDGLIATIAVPALGTGETLLNVGRGIITGNPALVATSIMGEVVPGLAKRAIKKLNASIDTPEFKYRVREHIRNQQLQEMMDYGPNSGILVHGDPAATGVQKVGNAIGYSDGKLTSFPHFENGNLVPGKGGVITEVYPGGIHHTIEDRPIFWGDGKPFYETRVGNEKLFNDDKYINYLATQSHKYAKNSPNEFILESPYRYIATERTSTVSPVTTRQGVVRDMSEIQTKEVPVDKLWGIEWDPLTGTWGKTIYSPNGRFRKYGGLLHKYPDGGELKPATITERVGRKWDNLYWQKFRKPKDYSDEVADTPDCARWSNAELRKRGHNIWGDAWTRSNNRAKKIVSGYDGLERPEEYSYSSYKDYVFGAADNVKKNFDWRDLEEGDIVGLYFRGSPNYQKAFLEGANGEAQTHTGHVVYRKRKPYIVHNVHGDIVMNKAKKLMGRKHPYGIVSVYRPYDFGGMLNF